MDIPDLIILPPNRVWRTYPGGKILDSIEGKSLMKDSHFPEDWIASTTKASNKGREQFKNEGLSQIEIGGSRFLLNELMKKFPQEITGLDHYKKYGANTQFLLKYLDSAVRLHIQVHPAIPFAQKYLNSNSGKTEAYVILSIRKEITNPYIYLGFQKEILKEDLKKIITAQNINKLLTFFDKIPIKPGDVFVVPGGLPHAIGEGVFMIEIMEPTDFVARLEFERGGYILPEEARFMGRDVGFALNMISFSPVSAGQIKEKYFCYPGMINETPGGKEYILIGKDKTKCFSVHKLIINESYKKNSDSFYVGIVTKGKGKITTEHNEKKIRTGDKFFIPYKTNNVEYSADYELEIIITFPPG